MQSLLSLIHPGIRCGFFAWLISRAMMHCLAFVQNPNWHSGHDVSSQKASPLWHHFTHSLQSFEQFIHRITGFAALPALTLICAELMLLISCITIYRFARKFALPHVAERTTWLWAFFPIMAWTLVDASWACAIAFIIVGLNAATNAHFLRAAIACIIAIGLKAEALIVWPAMAAMGWSAYSAGKHSLFRLWVLTLMPAVAFIASIGLAFFGPLNANNAFNNIYADTHWRTAWHWQGWEHHTPDLLLLAFTSVMVLLILRYWHRTPWTWHILTIPCLLWPLIQTPSLLAAQPILFGIPFFIFAAKLTENPSYERLYFSASIATLAITVIILF